LSRAQHFRHFGTEVSFQIASEHDVALREDVMFFPMADDAVQLKFIYIVGCCIDTEGMSIAEERLVEETARYV
jgi:hypothetical protein